MFATPAINGAVSQSEESLSSTSTHPRKNLHCCHLLAVFSGPVDPSARCPAEEMHGISPETTGREEATISDGAQILTPEGTAKLSLAGFNLEGLSIGGQETCIAIPSLRVAFDIGRCPQRAVFQDTLLISHSHLDHLVGCRSNHKKLEYNYVTALMFQFFNLKNAGLGRGWQTCSVTFTIASTPRWVPDGGRLFQCLPQRPSITTRQ